MSKRGLLIATGVLAALNLGLLGALITINLKQPSQTEGDSGMRKTAQVPTTQETLSQNQIQPPFQPPTLPPFTPPTSTPIQALQPTTTQTILTQENQIDTSDWKTYRNEEYGFEFRYPSSWFLTEQKLPPVIKKQLFVITISRTTQGEYSSSIVLDISKNLYILRDGDSPSLMISGQPAFQHHSVDYEGMVDMLVTLWVHRDLQYLIALNRSLQTLDAMDLSVYRGVLKSFSYFIK